MLCITASCNGVCFFHIGDLIALGFRCIPDRILQKARVHYSYKMLFLLNYPINFPTVYF
jgi:hypothetical protein